MRVSERPLWYTLDEAGNPIPTDNPEEAISPRTKRVAETHVTRDIVVSTVFLGLDHAWDDGPPILWETMVFGGKLDSEQARYRSRRDAEDGHEAMVERVRVVEGLDAKTQGD